MNAHTIGILSFNTCGVLYGNKNKPHGVFRKFVQQIYNNDIVNIDFVFLL